MNALLLLKASVILAAALVAARALRRAPAVTRHRLWTLAFVATLVLPLLVAVLPALEVPVPGWISPRRGSVTIGSSETLAGPAPRVRPAGGPWAAGTVSASTSPAGRPIAGETASAAIASSDQRAGTEASPYVRGPLLLAAAWLIGTTAALSALLVSLLAVRRLARTGEELLDPDWRRAADTIAARLDLHPVRLVINDAVGTPMAGGVWSPTIFLPVSARGWSAERRDVVLAHELAHLASRDPLRHLAARLAVALYWFHPLAWMAARQATVAREQACDEAVVALGTRPSAYARILLDLAESIQHPAPAFAALPMIERSLLETRLMTILNSKTAAAPPERAGRFTASRGVPALAVSLLTVSLAAAQPGTVDDERSAEASRSTVTSLSTVTSSATIPSRAAVSPLETAAPSTEARGAEPGARGFSRAEPAVQVTADRDSACAWTATDSRTFSGSISASGTIINEQVGYRGDMRIIQKTLGDLRVCMIAEGAGDRRSGSEPPSQWPGLARRVVIETRRGNATHMLDLTPQGGVSVTTWRVNGAGRPFDAAAERWRARTLAVLDAVWELSMLRGQVSSLRGEISSIRGEQSSMRGEISSLRGEVSSMRGRISSIRGEESSLRGQISSIRGHVSSLRGSISSERGAISSINGSRYRATDAELRQMEDRIRRHETEITRIEQEIRDYNAEAKIAAVEREIQALDTNRKVAALETEIRAFDLAGKVAAAERRIEGLGVSSRIAAIEQQIAALDYERRARQIEDRVTAALKELEAAIAAVR